MLKLPLIVLQVLMTALILWILLMNLLAISPQMPKMLLLVFIKLRKKILFLKNSNLVFLLSVSSLKMRFISFLILPFLLLSLLLIVSLLFTISLPFGSAFLPLPFGYPLFLVHGVVMLAVADTPSSLLLDPTPYGGDWRGRAPRGTRSAGDALFTDFPCRRQYGTVGGESEGGTISAWYVPPSLRSTFRLNCYYFVNKLVSTLTN